VKMQFCNRVYHNYVHTIRSFHKGHSLEIGWAYDMIGPRACTQIFNVRKKLLEAMQLNLQRTASKLTKAQLLLRWPCSVAQFECVVSLFDALFLSNLWEYHHKSYTAEKVDTFGYIFCCRHGSNFNHCDLVQCLNCQKISKGLTFLP